MSCRGVVRLRSRRKHLEEGRLRDLDIASQALELLLALLLSVEVFQLALIVAWRSAGHLVFQDIRWKLTSVKPCRDILPERGDRFSCDHLGANCGLNSHLELLSG